MYSSPNSNYDGVMNLCVSNLMMPIRQYTDDQLQNLMDDDSKINSLVDNLPQVWIVLSEFFHKAQF
jgi:hypothetical protein